MKHLEIKKYYISVCWMIFETVKDYLLDSAFSNRSLKMLKTIEMFKDVCWALSQYADVETSQSQSSTAPQCHHFNLSTLVLSDLEQMFKHCQRQNGPEDWVHLTKVTSWVHITNSNTNLDQISSSESRPSINFKISTKHQHLD